MARKMRASSTTPRSLALAVVSIGMMGLPKKKGFVESPKNIVGVI
jgi:hypothetical protein